MGRKEYEHKQRSTGPNSCKYHSSSASYKQANKDKEQNTQEKFKNTNE